MAHRSVPVITQVSSDGARAYRKNRIINNPLTLAPTVLGVGGFLMLTGWFGLAYGSLWAIACYASATVGFVNLGIDVFVRKDHHHLKYLQEHEVSRKGHISETSKYLIEEFEDFGLSVPAEQVQKVRKFYVTFESVLGEKFFEDGITHAEYRGVAEKLHIAVLSKLKEVLSKHRSVQVIDEDYIASGMRTDDSEDNRQTLQDRLDMKRSQESDIKKLIGEIEKTLTGLADLTVQVSNISDTSREAALDSFRSQASDLAERTNLYLPEKGV